MLKLDLEKWSLSLDDLKKLALKPNHPRTCERLLALYQVAQGSCATRVGHQIKRDPQTVMQWVRLFNEKGPTSLFFAKTGGRPPLVKKL